MNNRIREEIHNIQIPKALHKRSKIGILKAKSEMQGNKKRIPKMLPYVAMLAIFVILIPLGLSQLNHHLPKEHNKSGKVINNKVSPSENIKTLQTYLKNVFTGPSKELKNLFHQYYSDDPTALNAYFEKNYKPIIADNYYQTFVYTNEALRWLLPAYQAGFQLKPVNIEIQKVKNHQAYTFKVNVEYSKDGKTNKATITGYINFDNNGKISAIRDVDDGGLSTTMLMQSNVNNHTVLQSENIKTLQTYLKTEFTGPDDAFKKAMEKFNQNGDPSLYIEYLEKKYKPIVTDNVFKEIVNANLSAYYLSLAYTSGYQMKPINIVIKNAENNGYNCEVEVEYSKNGKTNKVTVKEYININDQGKISRIVVDDDGGLVKILR